METTELMKTVANGKVPIMFDMHEREVTSLHRPPPFYIMAPRQSYLPLVARSAKESFSEAAPDVGEYGVWFEHDGKPLRWNIPIGSLYDFYKNNTSDDLPFRVTIRFQSFPRSNLVPCLGEIDTETAFFHSMKQALCLRLGSSRRLMDMSRNGQESLWEGVVFAKFEKYWQSCSTLWSLDGDEPSHPQLPIRLLLRGPSADSDGGARCMQASVPVDGVSLEEAISLILSSNECEVDVTSLTFVIQGIHLPGAVPARTVWEEMCSHDMFLYVVARSI